MAQGVSSTTGTATGDPDGYQFAGMDGSHATPGKFSDLPYSIIAFNRPCDAGDREKHCIRLR